jgi:integrase
MGNRQMRVLLTDRFVASTKAAARTDYFDTKVAGLALRVSGHGKTWTLHYTSPADSKRARLTLGGYPAITLANARGLALEAKQAIAAGEDPRATFGKQASVATVIESYLDKHVRQNCRSPRQIEQRLRKVIPLIGGIKVDAVHRRDVNRLIDAALKRGSPIAANRLFEDLRAAFRWAVARGDLDRNPIEGMKRPTEPRIRERALSEDEIRHLWHVLPTALAEKPEVQTILRLCLVTAQRVGEVAGMRHSELDLAARLWTLPGTRTKNGHPHSVPLTDAALRLIPALDGRDAVFETPVAAVSRIINRTQPRFGIAPWSAHDLRRTAISQMAELGVQPIVLGHVANHRTTTKAGVTLAVYSRYTYEREKREALSLWADRLTAIVSGETAARVLSLGARHA